MANYLEHLSDSDLMLLTRISDPGSGSRSPTVSFLRSHPGQVERLLAQPQVFDYLLGRERGAGPVLGVSPFLVFATMVVRASLELDQVAFVEEWVGPRRRLPVFNVGALRDFLSDEGHRLFLAELLSSYTHVASGAFWVRGRRGWRRRRFNELDMIRLAGLLEVVPEEDRPGVYRRLGDLCLFLSGVFPDRSSTWAPSTLERARLARVAAGDDSGNPFGPAADDSDSLSLLEALGVRWYRLARATAGEAPTTALRVVASVAEHFREARSVLNFITDRYLWPFRSSWYQAADG